MQALQSLSVDRSMEPEKQKAEVKHFLLQKQRALADLFKMLAQIGQSESFFVVGHEQKMSLFSYLLI